MKQILSFIISFYSLTFLGQTNGYDCRFKNYDSLVIQTFDDYTYEIEFGDRERPILTVIKGHATINSEDAKELNKRIRRKESYGQNQEEPTVCDFKVLYYKKGKVKEEVTISLWTNYLYASFPLRIQRQGECLCGGNRGYCCSESGISLEFKKYLFYLLEKYNSTASPGATLNHGQ